MVEVMACGTPVIVSNLTAVPEVVTADCGVIIRDLSPPNIKISVDDVMERCWHPLNYAQLYDKERKYHEYLKLYGEIGNRHERSSVFGATISGGAGK